MLNSKEQLFHNAKKWGYKPEILEKVYRLLDVFQQIMSVPFLQEKLALKGGTALNLFYFEKLPRLSVDIDLNYIGTIDREKMLHEKPILIDAIRQILRQNQFEPYRSPTNHAGGKMVWFYPSLLGQRGSLEIDINFMYRQPLYPISYRSPKIEGYHHTKGSVLDIHEVAAGKLSALFNRSASRDWFDAHYLLTRALLDNQKLKLAFVVYLAMSKTDLALITQDKVDFNLLDLKNRLLPVMHQLSVARNSHELKRWATEKILELKKGLSKLLPLEEHEILFINKIRNEKNIVPELITEDVILCEKIKSHPAIKWAAK